MLITCLRDPKISMDFKIGFEFEVYNLLYSVDELAQSAIFENLLESNWTTLPKNKLFMMTCYTSVQIYKKFGARQKKFEGLKIAK
jgi:hypothetical protein